MSATFQKIVGIVLLLCGGLGWYLARINKEAQWRVCTSGTVALVGIVFCWRRFHPKSWHSFARYSANISTHWVFNRVVPSITAIYFLTLDIWQDWHWIKDYRETHQQIFLAFVGANVVALVLSSFADSRDASRSAEGSRSLSEFVTEVGAIVEAKLIRFRDKISGLKVSGKRIDKFSLITHPDEQLRVIAAAVGRFLLHCYGLEDQQFNLTIMRRRPRTADWDFCYRYHGNWHTTQPTDLLGNPSAAKKCLDTGEFRFFASKEEAAKLGAYHMSKRDEERGRTGSCFVHPATIKTSAGDSQHLISLVTYSKQLCDSWDTGACKATETFLMEFCRRIELELCLKTLKDV